MRKLTIVLLLFLSIFNSQAQDQGTDSLKKRLETAMPDSSRSLLLGQLSQGYLYSNPDTAMLFARQAMAISEKINFPNGIAYSLRKQAAVFDIIGNYSGSLKCLLQALPFYESTDNKSDVASVYDGIGNVYCDEGDYRKAISYLLRAKAIQEAENNEKGLLISLLDAGDNYEHLDQLDSALFYTQLAYELAIRLKQIDSRGIAQDNLGNIHSKMGHISLALDYYRLSIADYQAENDQEGLCESTLGMAKLFQRSGQKDSCLHYAGKSMKCARNGGFTMRVKDAGIFLANYFKDEKRLDSAFFYQEMTIVDKDSLFSQEKVKELQNLSYAEQQRQQELAEQKREEEEIIKKNLQLAGIAIFIPAFFMFVLFLSRRKVKPRTIEFLGILALLLVFEFITLFVHPYVEHWTHDAPVLMLMILVGLAAFLVPLHHKLEEWVKEKLAHKQPHHYKPMFIEEPIAPVGNAPGE